jgi:hypothetical protein
MDADAARKVPDLDQSLLVGDLRKAGWRIVGPDHTGSGGWQVSATKPFSSPEELQAVMAQVSPAVFHDFTLTRTDAFAKTSYHLQGTVDLSGGIDAFGDDALRQALGGTTTGRSPQALELEAGRPLPEALRFTVRTHLPGGGSKEWTPVLGQPAQQIDASSASRRPKAWLFGFAAVLFAAGFVGTVYLIARYNRMKRPPSYVHRPGGPRRPWETD